MLILHRSAMGSDQAGLDGGGLGCGGGGGLPLQFRPGDHQAVVGAGFLCLLDLLAVAVEAVGQGPAVDGEVAMAGDVLHLKQKGRSTAFPISFQPLDQLLGGLPDTEAVVLGRIPCVLELLAAQQLSLAGRSPEDARPDDAIDGDVASHSQAFRIALRPFAVAEALEEGEREARIGIEGAFIQGEVFVESHVDLDEGLMHAHG